VIVIPVAPENCYQFESLLLGFELGGGSEGQKCPPQNGEHPRALSHRDCVFADKRGYKEDGDCSECDELLPPCQWLCDTGYDSLSVTKLDPQNCADYVC
jgi:hypothetical protein